MVRRDVRVDLDPVAGGQDDGLVDRLHVERVAVSLDQVAVGEGEPLQQLDRCTSEADPEGEDGHRKVRRILAASRPRTTGRGRRTRLGHRVPCGAIMTKPRARELGIRIGRMEPGRPERHHGRDRRSRRASDARQRRRRRPSRDPDGRDGRLPARRRSVARARLRRDAHPQRLRRVDRHQPDHGVGRPDVAHRADVEPRDREGVRRHGAMARGPRHGRGEEVMPVVSECDDSG